MPSRPIYEVTLDDGRELAVIEWESRSRTFREVFVFDHAAPPDNWITIGPRTLSGVEEIIGSLPPLHLAGDILAGVVAALRAGKPQPG